MKNRLYLILSPKYKKVADEFKNTKEVKLEVLFINDVSEDSTIDLLRKYRLSYQNVDYISFSRNFGKEAALYAGLSFAKGDYIAVMDADLQDPPCLLACCCKCIVFWKKENTIVLLLVEQTELVNHQFDPFLQSCFME